MAERMFTSGDWYTRCAECGEDFAPDAGRVIVKRERTGRSVVHFGACYRVARDGGATIFKPRILHSVEEVEEALGVR